MKVFMPVRKGFYVGSGTSLDRVSIESFYFPCRLCYNRYRKCNVL